MTGRIPDDLRGRTVVIKAMVTLTFSPDDDEGFCVDVVEEMQAGLQRLDHDHGAVVKQTTSVKPLATRIERRRTGGRR